MYLENECLVVIIDSDLNIDARFKRMDWKKYLLEDYKRYEKNLNENNSHLKIHLTKNYINYIVKRNDDNLCPNIINRRTAVENYYVKNDAFELMKSKLNVVGKRKLIGYFPIKQFIYENGRYLIKIQIKEFNKITLYEECKVCFENNKLVRENGYFKCMHNIICDDCFKLLSKKCCPYCRSN